MEKIIDALYPTHPKRSEDPWTLEELEAPPFIVVELRRVVVLLKNKKAPGPVGLPAGALKAEARSHPKLLLSMYNSSLRAGLFHSRWKEARLVLISMGKGPANASITFLQVLKSIHSVEVYFRRFRLRVICKKGN